MCTIVIAEDADDIRALISALLRTSGYDVIEARDGDELERRLEQLFASRKWPAAVISDVRMPGRSLFEIVEQIARAGRDVPIIVITALDDEYTHAQAARLGVVALLHKPFNPDEVRTAVRWITAT